jgi:hypothetical protein
MNPTATFNKVTYLIDGIDVSNQSMDEVSAKAPPSA